MVSSFLHEQQRTEKKLPQQFVGIEHGPNFIVGTMDASSSSSKILRGNPKKRFLWRRSLPLLDPSTDCRSSNDNNDCSSNDHNGDKQERPSFSTDNLKFRHKKHQEESSSIQVNCSQIISPPLSEEEEENGILGSSRDHSQSGKGSLEDSQNDPQQDEELFSGLEQSLDSETCSKSTTDTDKSLLAITTAASVLLLMRFSVTDHALDSLTNESSQNNDMTKKDTVSIKEREATMETDSTNQGLLSAQVVRPFITRLAVKEDANELNSLHCFVRTHLLEVFSLPPQKGRPGRVGLRCVFCSHLPLKERGGTTMCTFYPKSLQDLYRR